MFRGFRTWDLGFGKVRRPLAAAACLFLSAPAAHAAWEGEIVHDPLWAEENVERFPQGFAMQRGCPSRLPERELSLFDLVSFALCQSPATRTSWNTALISSYDYVTGTILPYLPTLNLSVSRTDSLQDGKHTKDTSSGVSVSYLLFNFGKRELEVESAKHAFESAKITYNDALQQIIGNVISAYFDVLSNQEALELARTSLKANKILFDAAAAKYELGLTPLIDKLGAENTYNTSAIAVQQAENTAQTSRGALAVLLGLPATTELKLAPFEIAALDKRLESSTLHSLVERAKEANPDLKVAALSLVQQRLALKLQKRSQLPDISVSLGKDFQTANFINDFRMNGSAASVSVSIPLINGLGAVYSDRSAERSLDSAEINYEQQIKELELSVWNQYNAYTTARQNLDVSEQTFRNATLSKDIVLGRYKEGLGSITDVLTAESSYVSATNAYLSTKRTYVSSRTDLLLTFSLLDLDAIQPETQAYLEPAARGGVDAYP